MTSRECGAGRAALQTGATGKSRSYESEVLRHQESAVRLRRPPHGVVVLPTQALGRYGVDMPKRCKEPYPNAVAARRIGCLGSPQARLRSYDHVPPFAPAVHEPVGVADVVQGERAIDDDGQFVRRHALKQPREVGRPLGA